MHRDGTCKSNFTNGERSLYGRSRLLACLHSRLYRDKCKCKLPEETAMTTRKTAPGALSTTAPTTEGTRREAPANPPPRESRSWDAGAIRERQEQEATRLSAELDALMAEKSPPAYQVFRLRGMLLKLLRTLSRGAPAVPTAKPKHASIGDLIERANADPAGDDPSEFE